MALLRFLVASAAFAVLALARRMRLPALRDVPRIALAALCGITIYHLGFTFGESTVTAGAAALIIASGPIFTALLSMAFLGERLNAWGWGGVLLAFSGVTLIALGEGGGFSVERGALFVLMAAIGTAFYFVLSKGPLRVYGALEFTSYAVWFGTVPMLLFLPGLAAQVSAAPAWAIATIVYLGVFPGAVSYALWSYGLARMPATKTASFLYAQPVLAALIAWVWLREVPAWLTIAGGVVALAGVVVVGTRGKAVARRS